MKKYDIYFVNIRKADCFKNLTKLRDEDDILDIELRNWDHIKEKEQNPRQILQNYEKLFKVRISCEEYDDEFTNKAKRQIQVLSNTVKRFPVFKFFIASVTQIKMYQRIQEGYDIQYRMKVVNEQYELQKRRDQQTRIRKLMSSKVVKNMKDRFNKKQVI